MPKTGIFLRAVFKVLLPALLFFHSCGIESYYYLPEVPPGNITTSMNQWAAVVLPDINTAYAASANYFTHFILYYRIYISYEQIANMGNLGVVNPTLNSDYRYLSSYTDAATTTNVNVASIMSSRNYQTLFFETGSGTINNMLNGKDGGALRIEFSAAGSVPSVVYTNGSGAPVTANLKRSDGGGAFSPRPADRYFRNTSELYNPANIVSTINADVVNASGSGGAPYAFASIYIASAGLNEQTYTPIFSVPTFVGIFSLP
jgi:hypothetical protein